MLFEGTFKVIYLTLFQEKEKKRQFCQLPDGRRGTKQIFQVTFSISFCTEPYGRFYSKRNHDIFSSCFYKLQYTLLLYWARLWIFSVFFLIKVENSKWRVAYSIIIPHKNSALLIFIYLSCKKKCRLNHGKNGSPVYHNNKGTEEILTHSNSCTLVSKVLTILIRLVTISGFSPSFPRRLFSEKYHFLTWPFSTKYAFYSLLFFPVSCDLKMLCSSFEVNMALVKRAFLCKLKNAAKL